MAVLGHHTYVTSGITIYFLTKQWLIYAPIIARAVIKCLGINTAWKCFKQYLIVGRYLGVALNGLSLLWRHQNTVNEVKNKSKMADS